MHTQQELLLIKHVLASEYNSFISEELFHSCFSMKEGTERFMFTEIRKAAIAAPRVYLSAPLRRRPLRCKEVLGKVLHKYTLGLGDFSACIQNTMKTRRNGCLKSLVKNIKK